MKMREHVRAKILVPLKRLKYNQATEADLLEIENEIRYSRDSFDKEAYKDLWAYKQTKHSYYIDSFIRRTKLDTLWQIL